MRIYCFVDFEVKVFLCGGVGVLCGLSGVMF